MPEPLPGLIVLGLICLLYYLAGAMTLIGLALMIAGPMAAQSTAAFFIGTPFLWLCSQLAALTAALLGLVGQVVTAGARAAVTYVIDPVLRPIAYLIRLLIAGRPQ